MRRHATADSMAAMVLLAVLATACSGGDDVGDLPVPTAPSTTIDGRDVGGTGDAPGPGTSPLDPLTVTIELEGDGLDSRLALDIDPDDFGDIDPFGRFASCSGLRASVGAYSLVVSDPTAIVRSFSALTIEPVSGPGVYDADVRIELASDVVRRGTGTLTVENGLRSGTVLAFDSEGGRIAGSFECEGGSGAPEPLADREDRAGLLDTIELLALLEQGGAERVVGFAVDDTAVAAECRGAVGGSGPTVVRVDGDQSIGAVTTFELTDGSRSTMRLRVGGASYLLDDVTLRLDAAGTSGSFAGITGDGVSIDGAFRCT